MRLPVTMTSDVICPWCYIGERRLMDAISGLPPGVEVDVRYLPFQLNPDMPAEGVTRRQYRIAKFGSWERSMGLDAQVAAVGASVGLAFNYEVVERTPNTTLAHRLIWAMGEQSGDQAALATRLFAAYFTEGADLSDPAVLRRIAEEAGLSAAAIDGVLDGDVGRVEVEALTRAAYARGVQGVPLFEIGGVALSGAQPVEVIEGALLRAMAAQRAA